MYVHHVCIRIRVLAAGWRARLRTYLNTGSLTCIDRICTYSDISAGRQARVCTRIRIPAALSYPNMPKMDWSTWILIWIHSQEVQGKKGPALSRVARLERNRISRRQPSSIYDIVPFFCRLDRQEDH